MCVVTYGAIRVRERKKQNKRDSGKASISSMKKKKKSISSMKKKKKSIASMIVVTCGAIGADFSFIECQG